MTTIDEEAVNSPAVRALLLRLEKNFKLSAQIARSAADCTPKGHLNPDGVTMSRMCPGSARSGHLQGLSRTVAELQTLVSELDNALGA